MRGPTHIFWANPTPFSLAAREGCGWAARHVRPRLAADLPRRAQGGPPPDPAAYPGPAAGPAGPAPDADARQLRRPLHRTLPHRREAPDDHRRPWLHLLALVLAHPGETGAVSAQKLGQPQPFTSAFPPECNQCMRQLVSFWASPTPCSLAGLSSRCPSRDQRPAPVRIRGAGQAHGRGRVCH